jgi:acyl carrier protein
VTVDETLRQLLREHGKLNSPVESLSVTSDLYRAGLTSHATIALMLSIEDEFGVEFPQEAMRRETFQSIQTMIDNLSALGVGEADAAP